MNGWDGETVVHGAYYIMTLRYRGTAGLTAYSVHTEETHQLPCHDRYPGPDAWQWLLPGIRCGKCEGCTSSAGNCAECCGRGEWPLSCDRCCGSVQATVGCHATMPWRARRNGDYYVWIRLEMFLDPTLGAALAEEATTSQRYWGAQCACHRPLYSTPSRARPYRTPPACSAIPPYSRTFCTTPSVPRPHKSPHSAWGGVLFPRGENLQLVGPVFAVFLLLCFRVYESDFMASLHDADPHIGQVTTESYFHMHTLGFCTTASQPGRRARASWRSAPVMLASSSLRLSSPPPLPLTILRLVLIFSALPLLSLSPSLSWSFVSLPPCSLLFFSIVRFSLFVPCAFILSLISSLLPCSPCCVQLKIP